MLLNSKEADVPFIPHKIAFDELDLKDQCSGKEAVPITLETLIQRARYHAETRGYTARYISTTFNPHVLLVTYEAPFVWEERTFADALGRPFPATRFLRSFCHNWHTPHIPRLIWRDPATLMFQARDWWNLPSFSELDLTHKE